MNRKLFHKAAKTFLKETKWLFHGDGRLAYFPRYINNFLQSFVWYTNKISEKLNIVNGNQSSWGDWPKIMKSEKWEKTGIEYIINSQLPNTIFKKQSCEELLFS